jgi:hypothetical protein
MVVAEDKEFPLVLPMEPQTKARHIELYSRDSHNCTMNFPTNEQWQSAAAPIEYFLISC